MLQLPDGRTLWHRTRREVRTFAGRWPAVAGRFTTGEFPTEATELCIEAFLRAGNTFTVMAFQHAQPELVSIAPTFTPPSARRWTGGTRTRTAAAGRSSSGGGGRLRRRSRGRQSSSSGTGRPRCPVSARTRNACTPRSRRTRVDGYSGVKSTPLYRITLAYGENSPVRTTALASAVISFSSWWDTDDSAAVRSRMRRASTIWGLDSLAIV
jgi:hypothetical protein